MKNHSEKAWREFEKLAAEIEEALAPAGAKVTCPDYLPDIDTGELREVDASIRYKVGTVPILIILECRYRKIRQGTAWIEQLASKRASVGAAKCVAISKTQFTKPAIKKAKINGVELRNLSVFGNDILLDLELWKGIHYTLSFEWVNFTFEEGVDEINGNILDKDFELNRKFREMENEKYDNTLIYYSKFNEVDTVDNFLISLVDSYYGAVRKSHMFIPVLNKSYEFAYDGKTPASLMLGDDFHKLRGALFGIRFHNFIDSVTKLDAASWYQGQNEVLASKINLSHHTPLGESTTSFLTANDDISGETQLVRVEKPEKNPDDPFSQDPFRGLSKNGFIIGAVQIRDAGSLVAEYPPPKSVIKY